MCAQWLIMKYLVFENHNKYISTKTQLISSIRNDDNTKEVYCCLYLVFRPGELIWFGLANKRNSLSNVNDIIYYNWTEN